MVSQVSVHGRLTPWFLGMCVGSTSWQMDMAEETAHLMANRKQGEGKGPGTRNTLPEHAPSEMYFFNQTPPPTNNAQL